MKLSALHRTLQAVMGWENSHLHRFDIQGVEYGNGPGSCNEDPALEDVVAPRLDVRRSQVRRPWNSVPTVFFYEYDFGDSWGHELRVEKVSKPNPRFSYPRCLAGARCVFRPCRSAIPAGVDHPFRSVPITDPGKAIARGGSPP
jgi:hypothetical protein